MKLPYQNHTPLENFDKEGFIPVSAYFNNIEQMRNGGPWKIPFSYSDRLQIFLLMLFLKVSKFKNLFQVPHLYTISPAHSLLVKYLQKKGFIDSFSEVNISIKGYFCFVCLKSVTVGGRTGIVKGEGVSLSKDEAFSKSLGEILERLISGIYDENSDIHTEPVSTLELRHSVLYPPKYHRFLESQKKTPIFSLRKEASPTLWVKGTSLVTNETVYIPKQMTSWFKIGFLERSLMVDATTNGVAAFFTREGAVLRGLLEFVQRDAFLVHWLTTTSPFRIIKETLPPSLQEKIRKFEIKGFAIYVLDITALPIPSVCVFAINDRADTPQVTVSAASALTMETAIHEAVDEVAKLVRDFTFIDGREGLAERVVSKMPLTNNLTKEQRRAYWQGEGRVKELKWFLSGEQMSYKDSCVKDLKDVTSESEALSECLFVLRQLGKDYYPVAYFPKNSIQNLLGFHVAQVFIPKAFPLYLREEYGTFDSDRLHEFAASKNKKNWTLNTTPHMFI